MDEDYRILLEAVAVGPQYLDNATNDIGHFEGGRRSATDYLWPGYAYTWFSDINEGPGRPMIPIAWAGGLTMSNGRPAPVQMQDSSSGFFQTPDGFESHSFTRIIID
jgi:hypothetical protein